MNVFDPMQSMNALAGGMELGGHIRSKQTTNALAPLVAKGDYKGAMDYAGQRGDLGQVQDMKGQYEAQIAQMGAEERAAAAQRADTLARVAMGGLQQPEQGLGAYIQQNAPVLMQNGITQEQIAQWSQGGLTHQALQGFVNDVTPMAELLKAQHPFMAGDKRIDPRTNTVIADFGDPAPRRIVKGPDGNDYYEDTKERVLPNVQAPRKEPERATPGDTRPVSLGDGQYATYNPQTQRWDVSGGGGQGGEMPSGPQTFNADTGTSPFDSLGTYQGGKLIQARYDGEGFGGGGQGGPDIRQQGDFTEMSPFGRKPTDFDKTQDREVAKDIAEWKTSGQAAALTNLTRLQTVITTLRDPNKNTTGPVIGGMPGRKIFAPNSVDAQQTAEAAVQGSLKAILGGQFAQAEAQQLFARTYDPQLSEEVNAQRLELLYNDLVNRARLNEGLARYADQYGTTQGFNGYLPGLADFGQEEAATTGGQESADAGAPARPPFGGMVKREPVQVQDETDYNSIPSGAEYIAPDGTRRRKQ